MCWCECVATNKLYTVVDAGLYELGIVASEMHMAWIRSVCGRLKSDFQYSAGIVYNNFSWPENPGDTRKRKIEQAAQAVLQARAAHPGASFADLYDALSMPANLVKTHRALDAAVDDAYGRRGFRTDVERVAFLFELYAKYTSLLPALASKTKRRKAVASRNA